VLESTERLPQRRTPFQVAIPVKGPPAPPAYPAGDSGEPVNLREMLHVFRRNVWVVVIFAAVTTAVSAYLALRIPDTYQSQGTFRIADLRSSLTGGIDGATAERLGGPFRDPLLSQIAVMRSRTLLGLVVDREGLRLSLANARGGVAHLRDVQVPAELAPDTFSAHFETEGFVVREGGEERRGVYGRPFTIGGVTFTLDAPSEPGTADMVVRSRDASIAGLQGALNAAPRERTDLFDVSYVSGSPIRAQRVLQGVMEEFQRYNVQMAQQQSRRRRVFLEAQLEETDSVLAGVQLSLTRFREGQNVFSSRDEFTSQSAGLENLAVRREELVADRQTGASLLAAVERQGDARTLGALAASPAMASNPAILSAYEQLAQYEAQRDTLVTGPYRRAETDPDVQRLDQLVAGARQRVLDAVRGQVATLDARIQALEALSARRESRIGTLPDVAAEEVRLTQQVAATQSIADQLRAELQRARIAEAVEVGQVEIVDRPSFSAEPLPAHRGLRVVLGLLAGLLLGGGAAVLRERTNTTVRRREDLETLLGISTLAVVPQIDPLSVRSVRRGLFRRRASPEPEQPRERLVTLLDTHVAAAEAYRTLRTNLLFSQAGRLRMLVITSSGPAEGKTTTSTNLAATYAQQGMRVVLVDCDLRRPRVHEVFGMEREPGLTQAILSYCTVEEAARPAGVEGLWVMPSGTLPPNPSELLGSDRMKGVLAQLQDRFDMVILDTPPVLLAPDAAVLAAGADGVVMVVRAGVTDRGAAQDGVQQLYTVGANLLGTVLNDPDARLNGGYSGYYYASRYAGYLPAKANGTGKE